MEKIQLHIESALTYQQWEYLNRNDCPIILTAMTSFPGFCSSLIQVFNSTSFCNSITNRYKQNKKPEQFYSYIASKLAILQFTNTIMCWAPNGSPWHCTLSSAVVKTQTLLALLSSERWRRWRWRLPGRCGAARAGWRDLQPAQY